MSVKYSGFLTVEGNNIVIKVSEDNLPRCWTIKDISDVDDVKHYKVETSIEEHTCDEDDCFSGTTHYYCTLYEKDGYIHLENFQSFDEE